MNIENIYFHFLRLMFYETISCLRFIRKFVI